jgi:hypothetical protein
MESRPHKVLKAVSEAGGSVPKRKLQSLTGEVSDDKKHALRLRDHLVQRGLIETRYCLTAEGREYLQHKEES